MLMLEHFPLLAGWNLRIEGTDICAEVVERAQAGCYHRIEINRGLPARFVVRYFDHHGEDWVVKPEVKKMCNFRQANLCGPRIALSTAAEDRFDVIFLRNVMLYFSQETRKHAAGQHSSRSGAGWDSLSRLERAARRSVHLDLGAGRRALATSAVGARGRRTPSHGWRQ
jgi:chemotaxis protein methyltransferase CheR